MATGAGGLEVGLAGCGVADHDAGRTVARDVIAGDAEAVNEGGDIGNLGRAQVEFWHAAVRTAVLHYGCDGFTILIAQHDFRTNQVGTALAATGIRAMAETALDAV